jgi:hypothetical protein
MRPQSSFSNISNLQGEKLTSWQQRSRQKKAEATAKSQSTIEQRPEWNASAGDDNPHKLSHAELIQRKINAKSKNQMKAREDYQKKLEQLRNGKLPSEYKEITHKEKKFTSKEAFIKNRGL